MLASGYPPCRLFSWLFSSSPPQRVFFSNMYFSAFSISSQAGLYLFSVAQ